MEVPQIVSRWCGDLSCLVFLSPPPTAPPTERSGYQSWNCVHLVSLQPNSVNTSDAQIRMALLHFDALFLSMHYFWSSIFSLKSIPFGVTIFIRLNSILDIFQALDVLSQRPFNLASLC